MASSPLWKMGSADCQASPYSMSIRGGGKPLVREAKARQLFEWAVGCAEVRYAIRSSLGDPFSGKEGRLADLEAAELILPSWLLRTGGQRNRSTARYFWKASNPF